MRDPTAYDRVPYRSVAYPRTHPAHLAALSTVVGGEPPPVESARILEIGCGAGGNLVPVAASLPGATCLGVDPAASEIARAAAAAAELGVHNVEFVAAGVEALREGPPFDYVVAHGVLSWIPERARDALWDLLARRTAPGAVVYLSFNTLPGWSTRGAVRELLRFGARGETDAAARVAAARRTLAALVRETAEDSLWGAILRAEQRVVDQVDDWYLFHDHLAEHNSAFWFSEIAKRAASVGLSFVGDAEPARGLCPSPSLFAGCTTAVEAAQGGDFARMSAFREAVFARDPIASAGSWAPRSLRHLTFWARSRIVSRDPLCLRTVDGASITVTHDGAARVVEALVAAAPEGVGFQALADRAAIDAETMTSVLLDLWLGSEAVGARRGGSGPRRELSAHPEVWPVARRQCSRGEQATNLRHEGVGLTPLASRVAPLLDGTRDRATVQRDLGDPPVSDDALQDAVLTLVAHAMIQ